MGHLVGRIEVYLQNSTSVPPSPASPIEAEIAIPLFPKNFTLRVARKRYIFTTVMPRLRHFKNLTLQRAIAGIQRL